MTIHPTTPPSTDLPPELLIVDRWIESMQILTGDADNPTPEQHEEMAAMRRRMLDTVRAAVLREAADRYQGFIDNADTGADPRYWCGINDMVLGLRHMAAEKAEATT